MSSTHDSNVDVQRIMVQFESLTLLLKEISLSLSAIKQQNEVLSEHLLKSCTCQIEHGEHTVDAKKNQPRPNASTVTELQVSRDLHSTPDLLSPVTTTDSLDWTQDKLRNVTIVPYGETSPMDANTYHKFEHHFDTVLDDSDVEDRLNYLPPDDYRYQIPATRPNFLRNFMEAGATVPLEFRRAQRLKDGLAKELDRFEEYQMRLGTGYFWVRDYDNHGNYMRWDCISPPRVILSSHSTAKEGVSIPDSEWPMDWRSVQRDGTPPAPWRRIMYVPNPFYIL